MQQPKTPSYEYSRGSEIRGGILVDVTEAAQAVGLTYPAAVTASLAQELKPNQFLSTFGISFEERARNLLEVVRLNLVQRSDGSGEEFKEGKLLIPFVIMQGPLIREELISVLALIHEGDDGKPVVTLMKPQSDEEAA